VIRHPLWYLYEYVDKYLIMIIPTNSDIERNPCIDVLLGKTFLYLKVNYYHGLINYMNTKAKCRHLQKLTSKGTLQQVFICLRPPPLLCFCLGGGSSNFVGPEYGQIQGVKLLQHMVSTGLNTPPLPSTKCDFFFWIYVWLILHSIIT
jgi:hypothetical protein